MKTHTLFGIALSIASAYAAVIPVVPSQKLKTVLAVRAIPMEARPVKLAEPEHITVDNLAEEQPLFAPATIPAKSEGLVETPTMSGAKARAEIKSLLEKHAADPDELSGEHGDFIITPGARDWYETQKGKTDEQLQSPYGPEGEFIRFNEETHKVELAFKDGEVE